MFAWRAFPARGDRTPGAYLTMPALLGAGIRVVFTTKHGGFSDAPFASLNLSFVSGDDPGVVRRNRARVLGELGADPAAWTSGKQVHGASVARADAGTAGAGAFDPATTIPATDALWTDEPGVPMAVLTADCVPLVLADPDRRRVGVVHAGWRGLVGGVIEAAGEAMGGATVAGIGPSIGPCCYEVGDDVAEPAARALGEQVVRATTNKPHLDLWRGARAALRRAGVPEVGLAALCTLCDRDRFFSHRAGDDARQGVVAMLEAHA